jgi:hypothetical protein
MLLHPQPQSWSSDSRSVLFGMTATPILNTPSTERWGQFSPDGRWLAYVTSETGAYEVYLP